MEKPPIKGYDEFVSESETSNVNEGKMKDIAMIGLEAENAEDFRKELKKYLEKVAPSLANDDKVIDAFVKGYEN